MTIKMKPVYDLAKELLGNPSRMEIAQALTLNPARPTIGLSGSMGLFGSPDWWESIELGRIRTVRFTGIISRAYCAGQGDSGPNNMIDIITAEGRSESLGIYVNEQTDVRLFQPGHQIDLVYALDELKAQPASDGAANYSRVALHMFVSEEPVRN